MQAQLKPVLSGVRTPVLVSLAVPGPCLAVDQVATGARTGT